MLRMKDVVSDISEFGEKCFSDDTVEFLHHIAGVSSFKVVFKHCSAECLELIVSKCCTGFT